MDDAGGGAPGRTGGSTSIGQRVVEAVAEISGRDPDDVARTDAPIGPHGLKALFRNPSYTDDGAQGYVTCTVAGCGVRIWDDGSVDVEHVPDEQPLP